MDSAYYIAPHHAYSSIMRDHTETKISSWCLGEFDQYYVGDFSGDGIDELFCVQIIGGTTVYLSNTVKH